MIAECALREAGDRWERFSVDELLTLLAALGWSERSGPATPAAEKLSREINSKLAALRRA